VSSPTRQDLDALLDRWVGDGLVSAEQADRIRDVERARDAEPSSAAPAPDAAPVPDAAPAPDAGRAPSLLAELLGYTGGVLVLAAAILLVSTNWDRLGLGGQCALLGGMSGLLVAAGAVVRPRRPDGRRLRAVLWAVAVATTAGLLGLLGDRVLDVQDDTTFLLIGLGCSALAAALWWWHRTALQQAVTLASLACAAAALVQQLDHASAAASGLAVWLLGAAWFALGLAGMLPPSRAAVLLGPVTVLGACLALCTDDAGRLLVLATLVALLALAVLLRDLWLLGTATLGSVVLVPILVAIWFPNRVGAASALLVAGVVLLVAGVTTTVRRR
jgi:hypothetical protein